MAKTTEEILSELEGVVREVIGQDVSLSREMQASDVDGWDSMAHVAILAVSEETFGVSFNSLEIEGIKTVGGLVDLIEKRLNK